jgi:DMSO/TMAO reductase YedYZ molybdopterin-dependent catalytic subunit
VSARTTPPRSNADPNAPADGSERSRRTPEGWTAALAGVAAAGLALAVTELVAAMAASTRPSPVSAVAGRAVDVGAGSLKDLAISLFGTNDKGALVAGIVVVSLGLGALVGLLARWRRWCGPLAFAVAGLVGVLAVRADPQGPLPTGILACGLGALVGALALDTLLRLAPSRPALARQRAAANDPRVKTPDRRAFLFALGGVGVGALVTLAAGRRLRDTKTVSSRRAATVLPNPTERVVVPTQQPFQVDGLVPYLTPSNRFYRIDTAIFLPQINPATWQLTIKGRVDHPQSFSYDDLLGMDLVERPVTLACVSNDVGGNLVGNALWRGVPLAHLLDRAGVHPDATQLVARAVDDFTIGCPVQQALDGRTAMIAVGMNGEPLPIDHGYPARLIVAGLYGYVSATKWLTELELSRFEDFDSFWVERGWAREGPIKIESRIDVPKQGATVPAGLITMAGVAWAPTHGISAVEVKVEDQPWVPAELGLAANDDTWVQWRHQLQATSGHYIAAVRAYDGSGQVQTDATSPPEPSGATGYHYRSINVA